MNKNLLFPMVLKSRAILPGLILAALILAACQPSAVQMPAAAQPLQPATVEPTAIPPTEVPPTAPIATPTESKPTQVVIVPAEATIKVADDPEYGPILVDDQGLTLYIFTKDEPDKSNCKGECLVKWPPLLTQGNPSLGEGVDPALVSFTALEDGTKIVTYNHMPLYYWWEDIKAGDTKGQGVGEVWYVVNPAGEMITGAGSEQTSASVNSPPAAADDASLMVADTPTFGPILVDDQGMTLYIFTKDEPDKSNCKGECLVKWPPLLTQGNPSLGEGVDPALVGSTALEDGSKIVTYNHMPLYYWWEDAKAGDAKGQGVGEVWYVIAPDGKVIQPPPPTQPVAPSNNYQDGSDYGSGGGY